MSSPDTNPQRQVRRHRPSIFAIAASIAAVAVIAFVVIAIYPSGEVDTDVPLSGDGSVGVASE